MLNVGDNHSSLAFSGSGRPAGINGTVGRWCWRHDWEPLGVAHAPLPQLNVRRGSLMAKTIKRGGMWSMKADRELIALSKTKTLEAIADQIQRPPATILRAAKRLGLSIKRDKAKGT
jgi:hypothetical protein